MKLIYGLVILGLSCNGTKVYKKNQSHQAVSDVSIAEGERLASVYCQSCHMLPDPSLLNAASWEKGVLPEMGPRLGIFEHGYVKYPNNASDPNIGRGFYPAQPMVTEEEWQHLIDYYTAVSPDTLGVQQRVEPIRMDSTLFRVSLPQKGYFMPLTCMVRIDTGAHQLLVSDIARRALYTYDLGLHERDSVFVPGALVDAIFQPPYMIGCNIGAFLPNNGRAGSALLYRRNSAGAWQADAAPLFKGLERPVELAAGDLNGDGRTDYVVCSFGYLIGQLSWMENKGNNQFEEHVLRAVPGAIQAHIQDYNKDGKPDLWVEFAQGDEGIFLFTNKGNGKFEEERVLRFPPCYGSTYFELDDFNKDGHPDILYTCGDNGDYSTVLKPYHGVYIFLNDGQNHFTQKYFFPMNGCYRAMARDFDGDGNLDIAAISFFPDCQKQPEEGFVYLHGKGSLDFTPYSTPAAEAGRWMSMDVGDLDGDGGTEIVLGNCSAGPSFMKGKTDFKKGPAFMVLRVAAAPPAGRRPMARPLVVRSLVGRRRADRTQKSE